MGKKMKSRCCGRCDGINDICFADMICDIHNVTGCELCYGPREIEITEKIEWVYFFGGSSKFTFDRYYKAEINGLRVEKHSSNKGSTFSIGDIDKAKKRYQTESELVAACAEAKKV